MKVSCCIIKVSKISIWKFPIIQKQQGISIVYTLVHHVMVIYQYVLNFALRGLVAKWLCDKMNYMQLFNQILTIAVSRVVHH